LYEIDGRGRLLVAFCSRSAAAEGVTPGMPVAEAKGLLQSRRGDRAPHFEPHQPVADRQALEQLAEWCRQFSPLVGFDDADVPEGLLLDIAGCEHLFDGEQRLAERLQARLRREGYAPRMALADTLGAAWALARYAEKPLTIVPAGCHRELIRPLPVEALRLPAVLTARLLELDLRQIGQLQDLPRSTLPSRFGSEVLLRLDQALGHVPETIHPVRPTEPLVAGWSSEEPLDDRHSLTFVVRELLQRLLRPLAARGEGVLALECRLDCGGETVSLPVRLLGATVSLRRLDELFQLQLQQLRLPGPVSSLQLTATHTALVESRQAELFEREERDARRELARLIERLSSRLGAETVCRPQLVADAQPEHASRLVACLNPRETREGPEVETQPAPAQCRPLRLLEQPAAIRVLSIFPEGPPLRFEWDRAYVVAHFWGPERIATGWWRSPHVQRDYYRVETEEGRRFWLFRETQTGDWHLHGVFD
jgi:protein ImuB